MENRLWTAWLPDQDMGHDFPGYGTRFPRIRCPISKDTEPDCPRCFPRGSHEGRQGSKRDVQMEQARHRSLPRDIPDAPQRLQSTPRLPKTGPGKKHLVLFYCFLSTACPGSKKAWCFFLIVAVKSSIFGVLERHRSFPEAPQVHSRQLGLDLEGPGAPQLVSCPGKNAYCFFLVVAVKG